MVMVSPIRAGLGVTLSTRGRAAGQATFKRTGSLNVTPVKARSSTSGLAGRSQKSSGSQNVTTSFSTFRTQTGMPSISTTGGKRLGVTPGTASRTTEPGFKVVDLGEGRTYAGRGAASG